MKTSKLAIMNLDFNLVSLGYLFKIFESVVSNKIKRLELYRNEESELYAIATFEDVQSADEAFKFCDGTEIEQSSNFLNMSFVPDDMELDVILDECNSSSNFNPRIISNKKNIITENNIDISGDEEIDFGIPEEFRSSKEPGNNAINSEKKIEMYKDSGASDAQSKNTTRKNTNDAGEKLNLKDILKNDTKSAVPDNFEVDLEDPRFKRIIEDDEFTLDTSNKKYKQQSSSKKISEKIRKLKDKI